MTSADGAPPPAPAKRPELSVDARRGRVGFFLGLAGYLAWELGALAPQFWFGSPLAASTAVQTVAGLGLFYFAWRGRRWAHVLLAVSFGIMGAAGIHTAWSGVYAEVGWFIAAVGALLTALGAAMLFEPRFLAYFAYQREFD